MEYFWLFFAVLQFSIMCLNVHFSEKVKAINIQTSQNNKLRPWKMLHVQLRVRKLTMAQGHLIMLLILKRPHQH